jgi:hypothetical protein
MRHGNCYPHGSSWGALQKMKTSWGLVGRWGLLGAILSLAAGVANAEVVNKELIVRFREPQETFTITSSIAMGAGAADASVLLGSEGVVKLSFATAEDALAARERLLDSDTVENVTFNHLYSPALKLSIKDADTASEAVGSFLSLPLAGTLIGSVTTETAAGNVLPEVALPPSNPARGVDPLESGDWATKNIRMPSAARLKRLLSLRRGVVAAVIDTGVDYNHEDLSGAMWRHPSNVREVGYDTVHGHAKPYDVLHFDVEECLNDLACSVGFGTGKFMSNPGHGTHCAGRVGAVAGNALGVRGAGANAQIMALKFFFEKGEDKAGQGDDAGAIRAIDYAIKNGAKVISASWGGQMSREEAERSELKAAIVRARAAGVLFVAAAGNDGIDQDEVDEPGFPAAYDFDNMIVVAATDSNDELAKFSNYGAKSVHIAAPGVKILSTTVGGLYSDVVKKFKDKKGRDRQIDWDGTSMAAPMVAGAAALLWSVYPKENYKQIRERILRASRQVPSLTGKVSTEGVLDVAAALGVEYSPGN